MVLIRAAGDVVDRDPLLVLDVTGLRGRGVRGLLQILSAVPLTFSAATGSSREALP